MKIILIIGLFFVCSCNCCKIGSDVSIRHEKLNGRAAIGRNELNVEINDSLKNKIKGE